MNAAKTLADRCRHYALLHHQMRIAELEKIAKPDWNERDMLKQSRAYVENPAGHGSSYAENFDPEYVAELDAFEGIKP